MTSTPYAYKIPWLTAGKAFLAHNLHTLKTYFIFGSKDIDEFQWPIGNKEEVIIHLLPNVLKALIRNNVMNTQQWS